MRRAHCKYLFWHEGRGNYFRRPLGWPGVTEENYTIRICRAVLGDCSEICQPERSKAALRFRYLPRCCIADPGSGGCVAAQSARQWTTRGTCANELPQRMNCIRPPFFLARWRIKNGNIWTEKRGTYAIHPLGEFVCTRPTSSPLTGRL